MNHKDDALLRARSALISCTKDEKRDYVYWFNQDKVSDAIAAIDALSAPEAQPAMTDDLLSIVREALFAFKCTQLVQDYPTDHWSQRASRLLAGSDPVPQCAGEKPVALTPAQQCADDLLYACQVAFAKLGARQLGATYEETKEVADVVRKALDKFYAAPSHPAQEPADTAPVQEMRRELGKASVGACNCESKGGPLRQNHAYGCRYRAIDAAMKYIDTTTALSRPNAVEQGEREAFREWARKTLSVHWSEHEPIPSSMLPDWRVWQAVCAWQRASRQAVPSDKVMDELRMLVVRLVHALRKADPDNDLADKALDYLDRKGLRGSPLRATPNNPLGATRGDER